MSLAKCSQFIATNPYFSYNKIVLGCYGTLIKKGYHKAWNHFLLLHQQYQRNNLKKQQSNESNLIGLLLSSSETQTKLFSHQALFALNDTTPMETAQAVLLKHDRFFPVASLAAQQITATDVHGRAVAHAAPRSQGARFSICEAKIWRLVWVDQILLIWGLYVLANRDQGLPVIAAHHLGSTVEPVQQAVAHLTEMRHFFPARPQRARARQSVALALSPHVQLHCLAVENLGKRSSAGWGFGGRRERRGERGQWGGKQQKRKEKAKINQTDKLWLLTCSKLKQECFQQMTS